ncbi:DNA polymerase III subunit gamma/tau [Spongiibacter taiwanensis]|uniref:DNA polymerase III subunit gamma/tau n=1 Tax=Spongiibacter taiwanensis TaxID=1748242 RepID=UPI002035A25B|nr:DNA polymerase III subunit gamma/tau [Spongiibacter taiwanensis]USA43559.1 DNA polymerase III subunit gamma/tau [Spongiibacter taiwanensis]
MSYQVLARKWRPKSFREMAGQNHVLKALINALDHDRLHHAYLFTGTRGVGKTTIARILAKCLNCETGISSEPCGQCQACVAITENRFVDLIEVDAASRTKVEDTRELLDNVQYAPTQGRYKVYLIDEVHMLSGSSFNALLKTLEEPPPHVKFLLATTDPQKIPATILSRCLQFSLKNLSPEKVVEYLKMVLDKEMIQYEEPALWLLGRAADGSMRDALSLTDQGIAFGSGKLQERDIRQMLGTIDHNAVFRLIEALQQRDGPGLMAVVNETLELGVDPAGVVDEMLSVLHRLALAQAVPAAIDNSLGDRQQLLDLGQQMPAEDVQFFYQMTLVGRRDFGLSPDPRAALEMLLLRLLAFVPAGVAEPPQRALPGDAAAPAAIEKGMAEVASTAGQGAAEPEKKPIAEPPAAAPEPQPQRVEPTSQAAPTVAADAASENTRAASAPVNTVKPPADSSQDHSPARAAPDPVRSELPPWEDDDREEDDDASSDYANYAALEAEALVAAQQASAPLDTTPAEPPPEVAAFPAAGGQVSWEALNTVTWREQFGSFALPGMLGSIASHCQIVSKASDSIAFCIDQQNAALLNPRHIERFAECLTAYFERPIRVTIELGQVVEETPASYRHRLLQERVAHAQQALLADPLVQQMMSEFDGAFEEGSVELPPTQEKGGQ